MNTRQAQIYFWRFLVYAGLFLLAVVFLAPAFLVINTSLKDPSTINLQTTWDLPNKLNFESFEAAWKELKPGLRNSAILTVSATALSALIGSLNGYVLAKWRIPGAKVLFPLMLFGMFIPYQAVLIPLFDFMRQINLSGDIKGLVLVHVVYGLPITTLIFRNFYVEIPDELLEAAAIDGGGFFGIYAYVLFPLSLPGFVVVVIWQFTQIWNEFLFAVMLTSGTEAEPITVGLSKLSGGEAVQWNVPFAGAILAAIPTLLVYIILGRYFVRGLLAGSVKG